MVAAAAVVVAAVVAAAVAAVAVVFFIHRNIKMENNKKWKIFIAQVRDSTAQPPWTV